MEGLRRRCLAVLGVCLWQAGGVPAAEPGEAVRIAGMAHLGDLPTLVAREHQLFAAEGVHADIDYGPSGAHNLARLRDGEVDFALMTLTPLVVDLLADPTPGGSGDPVVLANLVHSTQLDQVVTVAGRGVRDPADLQGRRIGLSRGTHGELLWWLFATYHGFDAAAARIVDHPVETLGEALLTGAIDAAVLWEPWASRLRQRAGNALRIFPTTTIYTAKWVLVSRRQVTAARPGLVRGVLGAYRRAIARMEAQPGEAIRLCSEQTGLDPASLQGRWDALDYDMGLDWSLVLALQQELEWAAATGYPVAGQGQRQGHDKGPGRGVLAVVETAPLRSLSPHDVGIPRSAGEAQATGP